MKQQALSADQLRSPHHAMALRGAPLALGLLLSACATYPVGPGVMALPGRGASFDQFQVDNQQCRVYAEQNSGGLSAQQGAGKGAVDSAVAGTLLGAAAGALIGAAAHDPAAGAAIGAGGGLLLGCAAGTDAYSASGQVTQQRYDQAYIQCMYAKGHQVPVPASVAAAQVAEPAPVAATYPPPGTPAPRY